MKIGRKTGARDESRAARSDAPDESIERAPSFKRTRSASGKSSQRKTPKRGYLDGQMLIAMPTMGDERFVRSVIYVCAHSTEGAMGIIVNQPAPNITFGDLLVQLEVVPSTDSIQSPSQASGVTVLKG